MVWDGNQNHHHHHCRHHHHHHHYHCSHCHHVLSSPNPMAGTVLRALQRFIHLLIMTLDASAVIAPFYM